MSQPELSLNRLIWLGLGLTAALLVLAFLLATLNFRAGLGKPLPVISQVSGFTLTNQDGTVTSLSDLRDHVWVADIIFTRCPGPCLKMSRQMQDLQRSLPLHSRARLVTLTTDPDFDTPAVLKTYAARFGADPSCWWFLTGTKQQMAALARDSLKLSAVEKKPEDRQSPVDLFIHSTIFVLVDKQGRLRAIFETTGDGLDSQQVKQQLLAGIRRLEREP